MGNYQEVRVKLVNKQLNKIKSAAKSKTGIIITLNKKNFEHEEFPHILFLTTRQTTKIRNVFAYNISAGIKPSNTQIFKISSIRRILWFLVS